MQIEVKIDPSCREPKLILCTDKLTDEITLLLKKLSEETPEAIAGFSGQNVTLLAQPDLFRIYTANGKVFAQTEREEYQIRLRLYELEQRLDKRMFARISHSEIINLKQVKSFDLSLTGTIRVSLSNGTATYVSRRYVSKIKQIVGI